MGRIMVDEAAWEYRGQMWCHLTGDNQHELDIFASRLGLRIKHNSVACAHYDLSPSKRAMALRLGAVFVPAVKQARERRALKESKL